MDVLIAMMEQVRLSRDNYVSVMRGVKIFVDEKSTQKRGYKILSKVIDKFEINTVDELAQIKNELTPLMKGQPTKQRLQLIKAFVQAMLKFKDRPAEEVLN